MVALALENPTAAPNLRFTVMPTVVLKPTTIRQA
jgi:hypothetical protein